MKKINYNIVDPVIYKSIDIDTTKIQSISNLKNLIAFDLQIDEENFIIKNPPKMEDLSENCYINLEIELINFKRDIEFCFPSSKKIIIKDAYKFDFGKIIQKLNKKGYYFSKSCIKNDFLLLSDGKTLSKEERLPFLFILTNVQVEFAKEIVSLKYFHCHFFLSNGEKSAKAYELIDKIFDCDYSSIIDVKCNVKMKKSNSLFAHTKYRIELIYMARFCLIDNNKIIVPLKFDCLPTVYDAQENIAFIITNTPEHPINPKIVKICDKNKNVIEDPDEFLDNIQDLNEVFYFYFENEPKIDKNDNKKDVKQSIEDPEIKSESEEKEEIPKKKKVKIRPPSIRKIKIDEEKARSNAYLKIVFIFESKKGKEIEQLKKSLPVSTTIKEIKKMIANERSIEGKMTIKYQTEGKKVAVDRNAKIEDIRDKIRQKKSNGKIVNRMIVDVDDNEIYKTKPKKETNFDYSESESESSDEIVQSKKDDDTDKKKISKSTKEEDIFEKAGYHISTGSKYDYYSDSNDESESSNDTKVSKILEKSYEKIKQKNQTKKESIYDESDDDDNEEDEEEGDDDDDQDKNKPKPKAKSKYDYYPKMKEIPIEYNFEYNGNNKGIQITKDSTFKNKEDSIKKAFRIDKDDDIKFIILDNGKEIEVEDNDQKISNFESGISFKIVLQKSKNEDLKTKKLKIRYQVNNDKEISHALLDQDATVKTLKEFIQAKNKVNNIGNIKIIFAGKDLLNDISLKALNVGDSVLFVYIRSEEDILLLTAKALQI